MKIEFGKAWEIRLMITRANDDELTTWIRISNKFKDFNDFNDFNDLKS
jgi:hypothetical protein